MKDYLQLLRWPNVLITVLAQVVVYYAILLPSNLLLALNSWELLGLIAATALLTASGNVINDIHDVEIDKVNKPNKVIVGKSISEKSAFNLYLVLTVIAVTLGFIISNTVGKPVLSSIFIVVSFALYSYASSLKSMLLVGNIVISILVGLSILIVGIFELYPIAAMHTQQQLAAVMSVVLYFSIGAFFTNLLREWIKDCEDVNGDRVGGRSTIALALGRQRSAKFIAILMISIVIAMGYAAIVYFSRIQVALFYWIFLLMAPMSLIAIQLWNADSAAKFHKLSTVMKITMILGILFMFFYNTETLNNFL